MSPSILKQEESAAPFLMQGQFRFKTLEDARSVAIFIAQACPEPGIAIVGLTEVFINAIEHGNLGISSDEKTELQNKMEWISEIERRLTLPENQHKCVEVEFVRHEKEKELEIKVTDQGSGFDWQKYQTFEIEDKLSTHGRGLAMAKDLVFTRQVYSGKGNVVTCYIALVN